MVHTLIDHRNDVKMFKLKCNHHGSMELQAARESVVSLQSFQHYDVISLVDKSIDHGKLLSFFFLQ